MVTQRFAAGELVTSRLDRVYRGRVYEVVRLWQGRYSPMLRLRYHSGPGPFSAAKDIAERHCTKHQGDQATKRRRITKSRAWSWSSADTTGVEFEHGWANGAYVVRVKGDAVAQTTDKWMADMILAAIQETKP